MDPSAESDIKSKFPYTCHDKGLTTISDFPIITNPENFNYIISKISDDNSIELFEEINNLIDSFPYNDLLLRNSNCVPDVVNSIINITISFIGSPLILEQCLSLIERLIKAKKPEFQNYERVYQEISKVASKCTVREDLSNNYNIFYYGAELLNSFVSCDIESESVGPTAFFYFTPIKSKIQVSIPPKTFWPFSAGYSFVAWIKINKNNKKPMKILHMKSKSALIELIFQDNSFMYISDSSKISIYDVEVDKWMFLAITHVAKSNSPKFCIYCNKRPNLVNVTLPMAPPDEYLDEIVLFEDFSGAVSSCMIVKSALSANAINKIQDGFPYGIYNIDVLNKFAAAKNLEKVSFLVLAPPYCTEKNTIYNIWAPRDIRGNLKGHSGVLGNMLGYVDSTKNFMPYFHIARCLYGKQSTELMEFLLEIALKYYKIINKNLKGTIRGVKETNTLLRIIEHELQRADPGIISLKIITILKKFMVGELQPRVFGTLIHTVNMWINTNTAICKAYWEIIEKNAELYPNFINPTRILYIMQTMGEFNTSKFCCCNQVDFKGKICCYLNIRYSMIVKVLVNLIKFVPKRFENSFLDIYKSLLNNPCHCLILSIIEIISILSEIKSFALILKKYEGFCILCDCAINYTVDVRIACLKLARKLVTINENHDDKGISLGVSILLSSFKVKEKYMPRRQSSSTEIDQLSITGKLDQISFKKVPSVLDINRSNAVTPIISDISGEAKFIYDYLLDWSFDSHSVIPISYLLKVYNRIGNEAMLKRILNDFKNNFIPFFGIAELLKIESLNKWLFNIRSSTLTGDSSLELYKEIRKLHLELLTEAAKEGKMNLFRQYALYEFEKEIHDINPIWLDLLKTLENYQINFAIQFIYEISFGIIKPISDSSEKDPVFSLPFVYRPRFLSVFFHFVGNYCNSFMRSFGLTSRNESEAIRNLKTTPIFPNTKYQIIPMTYILTLLSICIQYTDSPEEIKDYISINESLSSYFLVLLEYANNKKDSLAFKQIGCSIIYYLTSLINNEYKEPSISNEILQLIRKMVSSMQMSKSGCRNLFNSAFLSVLKSNPDKIFMKQNDTPLITDLKNKFNKAYICNDFIDDIAAYLRLAQINIAATKPESELLIDDVKGRLLGKLQDNRDESTDTILRFVFSAEIRKRKCVHKWRKIQKEAKRWQGLWRDKSLFDTDEGIKKIPYRVSSHSFANGVRCLTQIRGYGCKYLDDSVYEVYSLKFGGENSSYLYLNAVVPIEIVKIEPNIKALDLSKVRKILASEPNIIINTMIAHKEEELYSMDCEIYEFLLIKPGKIFLMTLKGELYLEFFYGPSCYASTRKKEQRVMFSCLQSDGGKIVIKMNMRELAKIYKKQIIEAGTGLELMFSNGREILLHFSTEDNRKFFCHILAILFEKTYKKKLVPIFNGIKSLSKMNLLNDWENHLISTFDYILSLNLLSSRSFNNSSQYPVFPWVLKKYDTMCDFKSESSYRDLTKSIGMMGSPMRAEHFKDKYNQVDFAGLGHFNFGTHFSSPGIILQFMMRTYPCFEGYVELFGGLDNPNRMFDSIVGAFETVWEDPNDLRELIPEFFCFPDIFRNSLMRSFGRRDSKVEVDHVILPVWADSSQYKFICIQRECLETDIVSDQLEKWIDIIFGYQQRGEEAEKISSVYPRVTTDPGAVLEQCNPEQREEFKLQAYQWGQSPQQLFTKPLQRMRKHRKIKLLCDKNIRIKVFSAAIPERRLSAGLPQELLELPVNRNSHLVNMRIVEESINSLKFVTITSNNDVFVAEANYSLVLGQNSVTTFNFTSRILTLYSDTFQYKVINRRSSTAFIMKQKNLLQIIQGGYLDGSIKITSISLAPSNLTTQVLQTRCSPITSLKIDSTDSFAVAGTYKGECLIFRIDDNLAWTSIRFMQNHSAKINWIEISDEMQLFITVSSDGSANLYNNGYSPKLIRTFRHPNNLPLDFALLSVNPFPCVTLYSSSNSTMYLYSINGKLLNTLSTGSEVIMFPTVTHDSSFTDYLVYADVNTNSIVTRKLPSLKKKTMETFEKPISLFTMTKDARYAIVGLVDDECCLLRASLARRSMSVYYES